MFLLPSPSARDHTESSLRLETFQDYFSKTANSTSQFITAIIIWSSEFWNLLLWSSKNFHLTELKETLRFAVLNWLNIYMKTSNFHSLLFIWSFLTNIQQSQFSISLGILKNWKVQSRQIFRNPNYPSLCNLGKSWKYSLLDNILKSQFSISFLDWEKLKSTTFSNIQISPFSVSL